AGELAAEAAEEAAPRAAREEAAEQRQKALHRLGGEEVGDRLLDRLDRADAERLEIAEARRRRIDEVREGARSIGCEARHGDRHPLPHGGALGRDEPELCAEKPEVVAI